MPVPLPAVLARSTVPALGHRWLEPDRLEHGQFARVRARQSLVEYLTLPPTHGDATFLRRSCVDDDRIVARWVETVEHDP